MSEGLLHFIFLVPWLATLECEITDSSNSKCASPYCHLSMPEAGLAGCSLMFTQGTGALRVFREVPLKGTAYVDFLMIKVLLLCQRCIYTLDLHASGTLITYRLNTLLIVFSDHSCHTSETEE